jgi:hypothetical protein
MKEGTVKHETGTANKITVLVQKEGCRADEREGNIRVVRTTNDCLCGLAVRVPGC